MRTMMKLNMGMHSMEVQKVLLKFGRKALPHFLGEGYMRAVVWCLAGDFPHRKIDLQKEFHDRVVMELEHMCEPPEHETV